LIHYSLLKTKDGSFNIFNAGAPNMFCIVAGCFNKLFSENGKPFMFVILTEKPNLYTPFFGKLHKIKFKELNLWLVISNWRRLPTFKLTHIRDTYFSVLSSTMNSLLSSHNQYSILLDNKICKIFSLRTVIMLCTNQRVSELLVDTRYAYMSAFSTYTNIEKLLIEKFKSPYRCCLEVWIVERLLTRLPMILLNTRNNKIKLKSPEYFLGKRNERSLGGKIDTPSLWYNYNIYDIMELLDEIFIYVHTVKEPSNTYHEFVNAMKTIIEFKNEYDMLTKKKENMVV